MVYPWSQGWRERIKPHLNEHVILEMNRMKEKSVAEVRRYSTTRMELHITSYTWRKRGLL
jgi:hypothetical protein